MASRKAMYTWHIQSPDISERKDIEVEYVLKGDRPDVAMVHINADYWNSFPALAVYSDYKTCIVDIIAMGPKEVCFLWTAKGTEDDVSKDCLNAFKKRCGDGVTLYDTDSCHTKYNE
ncbi:uncharacterized protein [Dermacentor andersoni]|uniref:uncharacterized protein n=1 Tax=Dermacentor andersoni TaxID=34620 RepID=UPI00241729F8|nr:uncharacterized protein LOC129382440 [Dermacentor andersoni]